MYIIIKYDCNRSLYIYVKMKFSHVEIISRTQSIMMTAVIKAAAEANNFSAPKQVVKLEALFEHAVHPFAVHVEQFPLKDPQLEQTFIEALFT